MKIKERIMLSFVFYLLFTFTIICILQSSKNMKITTAECPALLNPIKYEFKQGNCEKIGSDMDLLQPSGLWINKTYSCWTLETPIEEWCKEFPERCNRNN